MPNRSDYTQRLQTFSQRLLENNCDAAFIVKKEHIFYFTGIAALTSEREAYLIITPDASILYHSPFLSVPGSLPASIRPIATSRDNPLKKVIQKFLTHISRLGIEKLSLTVAEMERLQSIVPTASLAPVDDILMNMRLIKSEDEIDNIRHACAITADVMTWIESYTRTREAIGMSEKTLAHLIENQFWAHGADGVAFPTIVAFDDRTASPHHIPTDLLLSPKSIVLVDMGAAVGHYFADMTRTWCLARKPDPEYTTVSTAVLEAYTAAVKAVKPGNPTPVAVIDNAARSHIGIAGYGNRFIHTTGHGLGLEAHETPSVSEASQEMLQRGMVITIEPGVYVPGRFGCRHEDTFLFDGHRLTRLTEAGQR